jgi:hypothetical protein
MAQSELPAEQLPILVRFGGVTPANGRPRYKGPKRFIEYKEAQGRTVSLCDFWHSSADAQAVTIHFTEGTRIHIGIEPLLKVETKLDKSRTVI